MFITEIAPYSALTGAKYTHNIQSKESLLLQDALCQGILFTLYKWQRWKIAFSLISHSVSPTQKLDLA